MDATGGIATLAAYEGTSPFTSRGYTFNIQGQRVDTTTLTSQASTSSAFVIDGQDSWFNVGTDIVYTSRGTSSASPTTIFTSGSSITNLQLVDGTKLYALIGTDVQLMSPVVKSGSGTFSSVVSGASAFYVYQGTTLYTYSSNNQYINKYTLNAQGTSATFAYRVYVYNDIPTVYSLFVTQVSGTTYVLATCSDGTYSYLYRYTDTGSAMNGVKGLDTAVGYTIYAVGGAPKPTCSDGFKNQDETDTDCGGSICSGCAIGKVCTGNADCSSNKCTSGLCGKLQASYLQVLVG